MSRASQWQSQDRMKVLALVSVFPHRAPPPDQEPPGELGTTNNSEEGHRAVTVSYNDTPFLGQERLRYSSLSGEESASQNAGVGGQPHQPCV